MNTKEFIILISVTCIVIIAWIIADIAHTKSNVPISSSLQQALEPLNPSFDQTTIDQIKKIGNQEVQIPPTPIPTTNASQIPIPTQTQAPTSQPIIASPSASVGSL